MNAFHCAVRRRCVPLLLSLLIGVGALTARAQRQDTNVAPQSLNPASQAGEAAGDERIVVETNLVSLTVTVTDKNGRHVPDLDRTAFSITDEKVPQEISYFSDDDAPASVGVIFDASRSMYGVKLRHAREALSRFIRTSHESDEYFLIAFNSRAQLLLDKTSDGRAVLDQLTRVETEGYTALYDAVNLGLAQMKTGAHRKRVLLVISDGEDNYSRCTYKELKKFLQESDVVIYSIGILDDDYLMLPYFIPNPSMTKGRSNLDGLSKVSGGQAFFPSSPAEMDEAFERIAVELRHQYSIGFRPSNFKNDGVWHRVRVKVTPPQGQPRLFVRSREGYYARADPK